MKSGDRFFACAKIGRLQRPEAEHPRVFQDEAAEDAKGERLAIVRLAGRFFALVRKRRAGGLGRLDFKQLETTRQHARQPRLAIRWAI